ncbi:MAG: hypothetical protein R3B72_30815 [Polyangiaceae bacterium]
MSFIGESKFLIGATVFHLVALPGAAAMAPAPSRPGMAVMVGPSEISVDVDSALLPPDPEQPVPRDVPLGPGDPLAYADPDAVAVRNYDPTRPIRPGATPRDDVEPDTTAPYDPGEVITAPEGKGEAEDEYSRPPTMGELHSLPGLGRPGEPGWYPVPGALPPGAPIDDTPAPTRAPKRRIDKEVATTVIQDGVRNQEKKLGLDFPGRGPIRNAFVSAVYSSDAPYISSANFAVSVSGSGKITAVSLLGFSGGSASTWKAVEQSAKAQLASAKLPMKSAFKKGANVSVSVKSTKNTPGGGVSREGATVSFDVTDIGARETRQVTAFVNPQPVK